MLEWQCSDNIPKQTNVLDLRESEFHTLHDGAFKELVDLQELLLDKNEDLEDGLNRDVFNGLDNLNVLSASKIG